MDAPDAPQGTDAPAPTRARAGEGAAPARQRIRLHGIVQGVGFRPFVYRLARELGLSGFVRNDGDGVVTEVEGPPESLRAFRERLVPEAPPLARVVEVQVRDVAPAGARDFAIEASGREAAASTLISPDVGICGACLGEVLDPADRRHRYAFTNCTHCGPRYTILRRLPYDRPQTSMAPFPLCSRCRREYEDPEDRRFHAQPVACPDCGPRLTLASRDGAGIEAIEPLSAAAFALRQGRIVALRGLGGFHLAADARREEAVAELRRRKHRPRKPFAVMAPDIASVERHCVVGRLERSLLQDPSRPIVLLPRRAPSDLAPSVAPGSPCLGFMLPSTPLHALLLAEGFEALVMTSGNLSEEPIAIGNDEALERLGGLADLFLLHDREILQRCDDSIVRVMGGEARMLRRSRGFVPAPIRLARPTRRNILAVGGELKNTVALSRGEMVFLSQHVGDLDNPAALAFFEDSIAHLGRLLEVEAEAIAHDLHPEYLSTKWARARGDLPLVGVQHHHAHLAAVMAEHGVSDRTIGIILDGTGYGLDGTLWGGEVLVGDLRDFERRWWLAPLPLPGGEAAIREPWRMAVAAVHAAYGDEAPWVDLPCTAGRSREEIALLLRMIDRGVNSPRSSGCGRLFDAVAAILGFGLTVDYEAQAAIELEAAADPAETGEYVTALPTRVTPGPLPVVSLVRAVVEDVLRGEPAARIAARFHRTLAESFAFAAARSREDLEVDRVALSGGVQQNAFFFEDLLERLRGRGFEVLTHRQVPPNDGGLALGQVVVADARLGPA